MRAQSAEQAAAFGFVRLPGERARLPRNVAVEEELQGAELELADVILGKELPDVGALGRVTEFVGDHRGLAGLCGGGAHFIGLLRIEGERLLTENVLARLQGGDGKRVMRARRRDDRDRGEVVPANELHRIGVDAPDAGLVGGFFGPLTRAAAYGRDIPAFGAERRDVDLRAEADADDADAVFG